MALMKIGKAAEMLGVEVQTLRAWEASGELIPDRRSKGGVRYYDIGKIMGLGNEDMPTVGYARVSSHDQKNDLGPPAGTARSLLRRQGLAVRDHRRPRLRGELLQEGGCTISLN